MSNDKMFEPTEENFLVAIKNVNDAKVKMQNSKDFNSQVELEQAEMYLNALMEHGIKQNVQPSPVVKKALGIE